MQTALPIAREPFSVQTLPGWLSQGNYGQRLKTYGDHLHAECHLRRFPLRHYGVQTLSGNRGVYWVRSGDRPASLQEYRTGRPVPEDRRGETLSYYVTSFKERYPDKWLVAIISFGDAGVNENRGMLTPHELLWVPSAIPALTEPRPWLVCWRTSLITTDFLCVEGEVRSGESKPRPASCKRRSHTEDVLPDINWALTGLPVVIDGKPDEKAIYWLDDDLRHIFLMPQKDGLYIMEKALLEARAAGWNPTLPLEVDLSLYGDIDTTIGALVKIGYWQVYAIPTQPGEFQIVARDRILCRPQQAGYAVSILGLCRDGSLGSFIARAQPTDQGYFGPSVSAQIRMVTPYFSNAFILDEGLDPTFYDLSVPPEEFPVRGKPGGRLSAVLCLYEQT